MPQTPMNKLKLMSHSQQVYLMKEITYRRNVHLSAARRGVRPSTARRDAHRPLVAPAMMCCAAVHVHGCR